MAELRFPSIPAAFFRQARLNLEKTFEIYKKNGSWLKRSFKDSGSRILSIAGGLRKLGIKNGDKVAIMSQTRSEWTLCDLAIQSAGGTTVPIYVGIPPSEVSFILENSDSQVLFVEKLKYLKDVKLPRNIKAVIVFDTADQEGKVEGEDFLPLQKLEDLGKDIHQEIDIDSIKPSDLSTIVYTSGTTGVPKGVMLSHKNILFMVDSVSKIIVPCDGDVIFAWLPFAHIFGRLIIFYATYNGVPIAYSEGLAKILENIQDVKPTLFPSVPRIYEKAYERIKAQASSSPAKEKIFEFAEKIGAIYAEYKKDAEPIPPHILVAYRIADKLVFSKIRKVFGGRIRLCISGGAAIPPHIARFFTGAGITLLEGYGLTETAAVVAVNREKKFKFGSIGLPIPGVEMKVAEDGELLIKSPSVMQGYYKMPEESSKVFTEDGWFKTGDIVEMDEEGFIYFKGRKKNIIVTSFGKNIAPEPIELEIQKDALIESCAIFGDEKPYLVALISLNKEELMKFAESRGLKEKSISELSKSQVVREYVKSVIDRVNLHRPSYERIHKFEIIPEEWTAETGELTPTLKVKRHLIYKKYKDIIEAMYSSS